MVAFVAVRMFFEDGFVSLHAKAPRMQKAPGARAEEEHEHEQSKHPHHVCIFKGYSGMWVTYAMRQLPFGSAMTDASLT